MNHHYNDIRNKIAERPQWWDEHAVPRYCAFSPEECANIYAVEVVLFEIECQACGAMFYVADSRSNMTIGAAEDGTPWVKETEAIDPKRLHYGDPPNACCASGATMNSIPIQVVEYWRKDAQYQWQRHPELEVAIECDWA